MMYRRMLRSADDIPALVRTIHWADEELARTLQGGPDDFPPDSYPVMCIWTVTRELNDYGFEVPDLLYEYVYPTDFNAGISDESCG